MKKPFLKVIIILTPIILFWGCKAVEQIVIDKYDETPSGLKYRIIDEGSNIKPEKGDFLTIHYKAKVLEGEEFENTFISNDPLRFQIGEGHVIKGWEEGLLLMSEGGRAEFVVPPNLAYGQKGLNSRVPPNATVIFEIELLEINKAKKIHTPDLDTLTSTPEGIKYRINKQGRGERIEDDSKVSMHYRGYFEEGSVFDNSIDRGEAIEFIVGERMVVKGLDIGVKYLREGDEATIWIPYKLGYGKEGRHPVPAEKNIMFDVEILDVSLPLKPEPFDITDLDTLRTVSGINYFIVKQGNNIKPQQGDLVVIHYTGYLETGEIFDSSVKRSQPLKFIAASRQVIHGLDIAVMHMDIGSKARFVIPPKFAYGDKKVGNIPPLSTLIFDIELLDIKKP